MSKAKLPKVGEVYTHKFRDYSFIVVAVFTDSFQYRYIRSLNCALNADKIRKSTSIYDFEALDTDYVFMKALLDLK